MDFSKLRKELALREENSAKKHEIIDTIRDYRNRRIDQDYESTELFKPIISSQQQVKDTIDKRQDKLIEQLQDNQTKMIQALRYKPKMKAITSGVSDIRRGDLDRLFQIDEQPSTSQESDDEITKEFRDGYQFIDEDEDEEMKYDEPTIEDVNTTFSKEEIEILKRNGYDPNGDDADVKKIKKRIQVLNGKNNSKDPEIRKWALYERNLFSKYLDMVQEKNKYVDYQKYRKNKEAKMKKRQDKVMGNGIRKYKQPKRNAYKINGGCYGQLMINIPRLRDEYVVEVHKGGQILYEDKGDKSLVDLLTKRFNPKKRYTSKAIRIFNDLNMLSNMPKHKSSGKSNLIGASVIYSTSEDLMKRLTLITGTRRAGNNNLSLRNEAWEILDHLLEQCVITKAQYDAYVKKYLT